MLKIGVNRISGIIVFLILLAVVGSSALAAEYWLVAAEVPGGLTLPNTATAPAWGFCIETDNDFTTIECTPSVPGPVLEVEAHGARKVERIGEHEVLGVLCCQELRDL